MAVVLFGHHQDAMTTTFYSTTLLALLVLLRSGVSVVDVHDIGTRVVVTDRGPVRGRVVQLMYGTTQSHHQQHYHVEQYLGVAYASPPTHNLRFMPPVTSAPWSHLRPADLLPRVCPQRIRVPEPDEYVRMPSARYLALVRMAEMLRNQSEDCLYLNIYKRATGEFRVDFNVAPPNISSLNAINALD